MTERGIVKEISGNNILVETLVPVSSENKSCCGSGSCGQCSTPGSGKKVKVLNRGNLKVSPGDMVEFHIPSYLVIEAFFRILILPPTAFAVFYRLIPGGIEGGAAAFALILILNFLFRKRLARRETPGISCIIAPQSTLRINPLRYSDSGYRSDMG